MEKQNISLDYVPHPGPAIQATKQVVTVWNLHPTCKNSQSSQLSIAKHASTAFDTLAWATGMRAGAGDHAIALFCIEYGCVLGLYSDTLNFEV